MIVEYIRYKIDGSRRDSFVEAYEKASQFLDKSVYCLGYELSQCEEDPENFILRIEWTSTEDHLNGFRKSANFQQFLTPIRLFFKDIQEMNHYQLTKVSKKK